jgi:hypothetical protein
MLRPLQTFVVSAVSISTPHLALPRAKGYLLTSSLFLLVLSGCSMSPLARHTAAFSAATALVTDNSASAYQAVNDLHEREQTAEGVLLIEQNKPWDPRKVEPLISPEGMKTRLEVLAGLKTYAQSLSDLSSGLNSKALESSTAAIGANLKGLSTALNADPTGKSLGITVSNGTANGVSTAAAALGDLLIAPKIKSALRSTTAAMDPHVQALCTLLIDDIAIIHRTTKRDYTQLLIDQNSFVHDFRSQLNASDLRTEIEKMPAILQQQQAAEETLTNLQKAIASLALTHHALTAAARENNPEALRARIADLTVEGQTLAGYYQSLPTK